MGGGGGGGACEGDGVLDGVVGDGDATHEVLELGDALGREDAHELGAVVAGLLADDLFLFGLGGVVDVDLEHEAVELGLGERIGAFLLDRVLGGEDEEGGDRGWCRLR